MGVTHYIWDELSDNVLMETDETGAVTAEYAQEPGLYGSIISQNRSGTESFYHVDGQGSSRQLTDASGTVTDEATYSAFGTEVTKSGATANPWGYKGALGFYAGAPVSNTYNRDRWYEPDLGRWDSARLRLPWKPQSDALSPIEYVLDLNNPTDFLFTGIANAPTGRSVPLALSRSLFAKLKCGGFKISWEISWTGNLPCDGFVVQHVQVWSQLEACTKACVQLPDIAVVMPVLEYWEAWPIVADSTNAVVDVSSRPVRGAASGYDVTKAEPRYFCRSEAVGLASGENGWMADNPDTFARSLLSTTKVPAFWRKGRSGPLRTTTAHWQCCATDGDYYKLTAFRSSTA